MKNWITIKDLAASVIIIAVGWLLIGYYVFYNQLVTGYSDWFMHAYRILLINQQGIEPWNPAWSGGMNIWMGYQFTSHIIISYLSQIFNIAPAKAMIFAVVSIFISMRVLIYFILRRLEVSILGSLLFTILSYTISQEWVSLKDFSIYLPLIVIPFYIYFWQRTFKSKHS